MIVLWIIVNAILSIGLATLVSYELVSWGSSYNYPERVGMGLIGGSVILTIGPLLTSEPTPFDGWATALLRVGAILYFSARLSRFIKHRHANTKAKRDAVAYHAAKGSTLRAAEAAETAAKQTVVQAEKTVAEAKSDEDEK